MSTCLSPKLFDYSTARMDIFHLSTLLGSKFMDAYVGLIASQKLQTELYILSYLLKDRVYPSDLWELVGERSIEAMQEETLHRHHGICNAGRDRGRHAAVEQFLMEERKKQCQMERIGSSPPLLSTWITADVQEAFYEAFQTELDMQSELMSKSFVACRSNANLRNHGLDLLILQAKMHRAQAEITLYTLALENTHAFYFSDHSSQTSWDQSILRPILSDELRYCDVDADDDSDQLHHDDFEVW
ncbi:uncharacterized protein HD556DRAFT_1306025 [Suillus plorans]|uniref:Uncharacterized protein n=1 Tax=Suillus plorans TaxID=116603 RepID=A0A9P7DMP2_9AGAM|nr:uncharacterized protein HD556DRAFT_1306025 [Suillus plorans]KAG1798573.1 hypothetical protein HD556DRAFT_1306025 [Suillus plorans]